jgi:hypothetical protein
MSEHEAIEKETVRLLVESLKREHKALNAIWYDNYGGGPKDSRICIDPDCPVCKLIRKHDK